MFFISVQFEEQFVIHGPLYYSNQILTVHVWLKQK